MSKGYLLKKVANIVGQNAGMAIADSVSLGMASALRNSANEIVAYTKLTNEALYYMQVRTFLETADLSQEEVNQFFENNPDNQRLGIEIFKILESTLLEKQAEYMAKAFKRYVHGKITSEKLYQYIHVIEQLNRHILTLIEQDLENLEEYYTQHGLTRSFDELGIMNFIHTNILRDQALQVIGFISEEPKEQSITYSGVSKPEITYKRTGLYLDFCRDIIEEEECTS
ncbi:Uncharacterised protein [Acinetobacter pittii]|uniref:hypothetical protein n=1 Tax=Acinetobacter pittii TaxID=48296 RepID=UPI000DE6D20E|nr:hypothetical protein [Acinetobacter pittii]SSP30246.1 Uncharacterised protein [Acinetobacter pittii]